MSIAPQSLQSFASYKSIPLVPDRIITRLASMTTDDAEMLWKLLRYTDVECLGFPNLTYEEKLDMMWTPEANNATQEDLFTIFLKPLVPSALNTAESQIQLRIYRTSLSSRDQYSGVASFAFDILTNEVSCMVRYQQVLVERTDLIEALLIEILNGYDIGIGQNGLRFDRVAGGNSESRMSINNSKSIFGRTFIMILEMKNNQIKRGICDG